MNVFELFAKIGLDAEGFHAGLKKAGSAMASFGSQVGSAMLTVGKVSTKALGALTVAGGGAVVKLTKDVTAAYGEFQQLEGGVKKLFEDSADEVMKYADNAYKTSGLSANAYMEQVTRFSASLISSLEGDTKKAAELADVAVRAMSDNANVFGTDIKSIQDAYQGFAKQNYTMLDNLRLGYGGTASEMARLINESGVLGDTMQVTAKTVNSVGFDKIIEAIQITQERMNIAGQTAAEAAGTITGSLSAVRAAWQNVVTAMGEEGGDISGKVQALAETAAAFGKNIIPTIQTAISGIGTMVSALTPELVKAIPSVIDEVLPKLVDTISKTVPVLVSSVKQVVTTLAKQIPKVAPTLIQAWRDLFIGMIDALKQVVEEIVPMLPELIQTLADAIAEGAPLLIEAGLKLLAAILNGINDNIDQIIQTISDLIPVIVDTIVNNLPQILAVGGQIIYKLVTGIGDHIPDIVGGIAEVIGALLVEIGSHWDEIVEAGADMIGAIAMGIVNSFAPIHDALSDIFLNIAGWFEEKWDAVKEFGSGFITYLKDGIVGAVQTVLDGLGEIWDSITGFFKGVWDECTRIGERIIEGIVEGFKKGWEVLSGAVTDDFFDNWMVGIKDMFGIHSPSTIMRDQVGKMLAEGIGVGFEEEMQNVNAKIQDNIPTDFGANISVNATAGGGTAVGRSEDSRIITLRLADGWGRIVAEGTTSAVSLLQGESIVLSERGLAT